jgi:hypothetical protein
MARLLSTVLLLVASAVPASGQVVADTAEVRAAGTAERSVPPDVASVTLRFAVVDSTPGAAGARLASRADTVRRALMALGIPRDSLLTGSRWGWWNRRVEEVLRNECVPVDDRRVGCINVTDTTYRVHEQILVRIPDLSKVGAVIDAALDLRITDLSDVTFYATDTKAATLEATADATRSARDQARAMAETLGLELGQVLSVSTDRDYGPQLSLFTAMSAQGSRAGTEITAPMIVVRVTVYGRWLLRSR